MMKDRGFCFTETFTNFENLAFCWREIQILVFLRSALFFSAPETSTVCYNHASLPATQNKWNVACGD